MFHENRRNFFDAGQSCHFVALAKQKSTLGIILFIYRYSEISGLNDRVHLPGRLQGRCVTTAHDRSVETSFRVRRHLEREGMPDTWHKVIREHPPGQAPVDEPISVRKSKQRPCRARNGSAGDLIAAAPARRAPASVVAVPRRCPAAVASVHESACGAWQHVPAV
jgi:hypothetical protein